MTKIKVTHRETGDVVEAEQYIAGKHPPPSVVKVTMGKNGVLARAKTVHGDHSVLLTKDWLVWGPAGLEIYTDSFMQSQFSRDGEPDDEPAKPLQLG